MMPGTYCDYALQENLPQLTEMGNIPVGGPSLTRIKTLAMSLSYDRYHWKLPKALA